MPGGGCDGGCAGRSRDRGVEGSGPVDRPAGLPFFVIPVYDSKKDVYKRQVNGFSGLADAWFDGVPLMCISGNVPTNEQRGFSGVRQNGFQEMDIVSMTKHITKYSVAPNLSLIHI